MKITRFGMDGAQVGILERTSRVSLIERPQEERTQPNTRDAQVLFGHLESISAVSSRLRIQNDWAITRPGYFRHVPKITKIAYFRHNRLSYFRHVPKI